MSDFVQIKPFVVIPDNSFGIFATLLIIICFAILLIFLNYFYKNKKNKNLTKNTSFLEVDFDNAKKTAYFITKNVPSLIGNNSQKEAFNALLKVLEKYKYKKHVPPFSHGDKEKIKKFLENCYV